MGIPIFSEIERLINEHGSAAIMKERLELAKEQYAALEKKLADAEARATKAEADSQRFELESLRLTSKVRELEDQLTTGKSERVGELREAILVLLSNRGELDTDRIAHELGIREQLAVYHLTEMQSAEQISMRQPIRQGGTLWSLAQAGRAYMVQHGLLQ